MRFFVGVAMLALVLAGAASAKLGALVRVSDDRPRVGQPVRVSVRLEERSETRCSPPLVAVAPGRDVSTAVEAFFGGGVSVLGPSGFGFKRIRATPRLGVEPKLVRSGPRTWRGVVRFPRRGRWELVVAGECTPGWMYPWPASRAVVVR